MTTEAPIFCEAGILYASPRAWEHAPQGMTEVKYYWRHLRNSDDCGKGVVYLYNYLDIDRLLSHWNRQEDWKYWSGF